MNLMKPMNSLKHIVLILALFLPVFGYAQTLVTVDPAVQKNAQRVGMSIGTPTSYDEALYYSNLLLPHNTGGAPAQIRQAWQIFAGAGSLSATSFNTNNTNGAAIDQVPANFFAGAKFEIAQSCNNTNQGLCLSPGAELGCIGTVASNTTASGSSPFGATYTMNPATNQGSSGCAASFRVGDVVILTQTLGNSVLWNVNTSGSGSVTLQQSDISWCQPGCGNSTFLVNTAGGSATIQYQVDNLQAGSNFPNRFRPASGAYQFSGQFKCVSGTCALIPAAARSGGLSCNQSSPTTLTPVSAGSTLSLSCTVAEGATPTSGNNSGIFVNFVFSGGGIMEASSLSFGPITTTSGTIYTDAYVNQLKQDMGTGLPGKPATLRYNPNPSGETMDTWLLPATARYMTNTGTSIGSTGFYNGGEGNASLQDFLQLCHVLQVDPYLILPVTFSVTEADNFVDFLTGSTGTTYGAKRVALGGPSGGYQTWFGTIHVEIGNEDWNTGFTGFSLGPRITPYQDYMVRFGTLAASMRGMSSYVPSQMELDFNYQTAHNGAYLADFSGLAGIITAASPDAVEFEEYSQGSVSDFSTNALLFTPAFAESFINLNDTTDTRGVYGSYHTIQGFTTGCGGGSHTSQCIANIYEQNNGTQSGAAPQASMDGFAPGAAYGIITANQILANIQTAGIGSQNMYEAAQYYNFSNSIFYKIFGMYIDFGGACSITNSATQGGNACPRSTAIGYRLANQAIIGKEIGSVISGATGNVLYNLPTNNNDVPSFNNIPTIYAYCFQSSTVSTNYTCELINESLTTAYPITFAGAAAPTTGVTVTQFAPSSPTLTNDVASNGVQNAVTTPLFPTVITGQNLTGGITIPADSITVLNFSTTATVVGGTVHKGNVRAKGNVRIK